MTMCVVPTHPGIKLPSAFAIIGLLSHFSVTDFSSSYGSVLFLAWKLTKNELFVT